MSWTLLGLGAAAIGLATRRRGSPALPDSLDVGGGEFAPVVLVRYNESEGEYLVEGWKDFEIRRVAIEFDETSYTEGFRDGLAKAIYAAAGIQRLKRKSIRDTRRTQQEEPLVAYYDGEGQLSLYRAPDFIAHWGF